MINTIITAANDYIDSVEYDAALKAIAKKFSLDMNGVGYVSGSMAAVILGAIPETDFVKRLVSTNDFELEEAENIYVETKTRVFTPFKTKLAKIVIDKQQEAFSESTPIVQQAPLSAQDKLLRTGPVEKEVEEPEEQEEPPQPVAPAYRPADPLNKDHILSQIENPPRTVVKRYVIEHEHESVSDHTPITDPDHLIDDTVEQRAKLEAHYNK